MVKKKVDIMTIEKDAARYRYLKTTQTNGCRDMLDEMDEPNRVGVIDHIFVYLGDGVSETIDDEMMDKSIDNAMLLFPKEEGNYDD